jgi:hypothetical protein
VIAQGCGGSGTVADPLPPPASDTGSQDTHLASQDSAVDVGATCARDSDCGSAQKCSETRQCIGKTQCNTDADCGDSGGRPFCDSSWHSCQPCRGALGCPADKPVCTSGWESGLICAECVVGHSSTCAAGSWCTDEVTLRTPTCAPADCVNDRKGPGCTACLNEHAELCFNGLASGSECTGALLELRSCISAVYGDEADSCPVDRIPAMRGCVPSECKTRADAVDSCLYDCQAALLNCMPHP